MSFIDYIGFQLILFHKEIYCCGVTAICACISSGLVFRKCMGVRNFDGQLVFMCMNSP